MPMTVDVYKRQAGVLGVSPQAVSRWEANGGYPDMELIPAIANFFNVSIDELFGYSKDRQEKDVYKRQLRLNATMSAFTLRRIQREAWATERRLSPV